MQDVGNIGSVPSTGFTFLLSQFTVFFTFFCYSFANLSEGPKVLTLLFQFPLFIYDAFVIVFYTFGIINYVNVEMSISKKSVKS